MSQRFSFTTICMVMLATVPFVHAQSPPPPPTLVSPESGSSLVQPITVQWNAVVDPDGPIGSYIWQVGISSAFSTVILEGATNLSMPDMPMPTHDVVSGLPNGTYYWRVKATQMVDGPVGSLESPWSAVRTVTVTGLGPAPGTPSFTAPATGSQFHALEFFQIHWTTAPDAHHYLLEVDDEPAFSYPLTLTTDLLQFGTTFQAGWGNEIPNIYYRVRAVSAGNVRGLPSSTLNVKITNTAPVPSAPAPLAPSGGATVSVPFTFDWTDTPNPQIAGYDLDVDDEPNFQGPFGVLFVQNISRSDYMLAESLAPGTYYWRVRAIHGAVYGPWSAGASFTVVAPPPTPPGLRLFWIITEPGSVYGGNQTQACVTLNMPAPPGGAMVSIASDLPHAQTPTSIFIPEGATDATVSPITTIPVPGATVGTLRAAYGGGWQQSSLGLFPLIWALSLNNESVIGGAMLTGTVTLNNPAPPGGITVALVSSDIALVTPPPTVSIPAGETGATFDIPTAAVSVPTLVRVETGSGLDNYRAPSNSLILMPAASAPPAPSLAALILESDILTGGSVSTGTVTLTSPAPAGGALVLLSGSMEGQVVVPPSVTVPAGSLNADFDITAPQVNTPHFVIIQGNYGSFAGTQGKLLEVVPGSPVPPTLLAMVVNPPDVIGGNPVQGTVGLVMPAPSGGGDVSLTSDNPAVVQVPSTVTIAEGNSADSFTITTSTVTVPTTMRIDATAGGVTQSSFINLGPDPNAPALLQDLSLNPTTVQGGGTVTGTVFLSAAAPPGGLFITLATGNSNVAQVPPIVGVAEGQTSGTFTVTTFSVSSNTQVTIMAYLNSASQSADLTVTPGASLPGTPTLLSPANGATPTQPVALDWTNASNAASYEIQLDDNNNFNPPLIASLTSTTSQNTVTGLPTIQHWWRVRALNAAGMPGNWSNARRFTPFGVGDINADGAVNMTDQAVFVDVLLGSDTNTAHASASDMNADGSTDGEDIVGFVSAMLD